MVGRRQIHQAIHSRMMKRNADDDVVQWDQIVQTLVNELKHEVASFYGNEGSDLEKQYPGFNYLDDKIRLRLSRWPWHRSFFKAIDYLALSDSEIDSVVTWWGTLKERRAFEARTGTVIHDTTGDDIPTWEEVQKMNAERLAQENALRDHLLAYGMQQSEVENVLREADCLQLAESMERTTGLQAQALASYRQFHQVESLFGVARE
ncbi:hypothetical protein TWF696_009472 [Orbilia brochopaga]|uniref:Uncharacterized protein n=1 Tax=Orbilia brochopaga TaxID=3140254 RepID=A0AAV9UEE7_9PEZI